MASPADGLLHRTRLVSGSIAGVVAFLVGYVVTYAWQAPAVDDALGGVNAIAQLVGAEAVPTWKGVSWLFLNAHLVPTRTPALGGGDRLVNFVRASDDGSLALLYLVAPVLLVVAGMALARAGPTASVGEAAAAGATAAVGYLPATVVLALASRHTFGGDVTVAPDLLTAVAVAGVLVPALFGAVGGAVWRAFGPAG